MRVEFLGFGEPDPLEALPDLSEFGNAITLNLPNGTIFHPADYIAFGYTNYELLCIGAAGGKAGLTQFNTAETVARDNELRSMGGAGGGGGLHISVGLLVDLPDDCPVVVGVAGADGADGPHTVGDPTWAYGHVVAIPGVAGGDGGVSSFNATTCRASGGKGGSPSPVTEHNFKFAALTQIHGEPTSPPGGNGGNGGKGGRTTAGGGGAGAISVPNLTRWEARTSWIASNPDSTISAWDTTDAVEGIWDGAIGEGGGGGRGGTKIMHEVYSFDPELIEVYPASSGVNGSFSFGDTSRYGPKTLRSLDGDQLIVPGAGGGAKATPTSIFGGRSLGASPNGVVRIRLSKVA